MYKWYESLRPVILTSKGRDYGIDATDTSGWTLPIAAMANAMAAPLSHCCGLGRAPKPTSQRHFLWGVQMYQLPEHVIKKKCLGWFSAAPRHHSHSVLRNLRSHALQQDNLAPWYLGTRPVTSCRNQSPFGSWWRKLAETFHMCLNHQHPPTKKHVHIHVYVYTYSLYIYI